MADAAIQPAPYEAPDLRRLSALLGDDYSQSNWKEVVEFLKDPEIPIGIDIICILANGLRNGTIDSARRCPALTS
jgi:hypothetical protein